MIRLSKSTIHEDDIQAVVSVLQREFLGMGPETKLFEEELSKFFGRQSLCVVNGTAALQLALQAVGVSVGHEVLVPSITYVASYQAITACGAIPVSCDVLPDSLTIDPRDALKQISSRTRAIMPVHYGGGVGELKNIYEIAHDHNLRVVEDAAHAFGSRYLGERVGSFGDVSCFSFDGIKNITSGEGGAVVSDDLEVLRKVSDARLLGVENDSQIRYEGKRSWQFEVSSQGWRYHMSDLMAAIGRSQLTRFESNSLKRKSLATHYDTLFSGDDIINPLRHDYEQVTPHIYVVRIKGLKNRESLRSKMLSHGIQTGIHYHPNHRLKLFRPCNQRSLQVTEKVFPELLTLPLHLDLTYSEVATIARTLRESLEL